MKKILCTGAGGFIGKYLITELLKDKDYYIVIIKINIFLKLNLIFIIFVILKELIIIAKGKIVGTF